MATSALKRKEAHSSAGREEAQAGGRVLLVEDNREVAQAAEGMLTAAGYSVAWADSATAALALLDGGETFDAVLSDIVMEGGMSGLELASAVKRRWPDLPIVLMTGYSEALGKGATTGLPVLSKPFGEAEVVAAIRAARSSTSAEPAPDNIIRLPR